MSMMESRPSPPLVVIRASFRSGSSIKRACTVPGRQVSGVSHGSMSRITTGGHVLSHTLDSLGEVLEGFDIAYSTEETGDDVKRPSQVEGCHIRVVQGDTWIPLASNGK